MCPTTVKIVAIAADQSKFYRKWRFIYSAGVFYMLGCMGINLIVCWVNDFDKPWIELIILSGLAGVAVLYFLKAREYHKRLKLHQRLRLDAMRADAARTDTLRNLYVDQVLAGIAKL